MAQKRSNAKGIHNPTGGNGNRLKEDGILTKRDLTEIDETGIGTWMDDAPSNPIVASFFKYGSYDWDKCK